MIPVIVISLASLCTSALTLYSGFGLGTLLLPVFALFFPLEMAVAATAVVHGANSIFKISVAGRYADRSLVLAFGIPAIIAAFAGAALLAYVSTFDAGFSYSIGTKTAVITPIKVILALLMIAFSLFELLPALRHITFERKYLLLGGLLSGFFGGLSGHQGALRSAFLVKVGVSTEAFVGTNAMIGFMVDMTRISTYALLFWTMAGPATQLDPGLWGLIGVGIVSALAGVLLGKRYIKKITMKTIQTITGVLLMLIALALGSGFL